MWKEFKEFAVKGSVIDLAVGVMIGAAFGGIVASLVEDVLTPLLMDPILKASNIASIEDYKIGPVRLGKFISAIIQFLIIGIVLFWLVKIINKMKKTSSAEGPSSTDLLLTEIRDLLKK